ncbi:MAG: BamA/TamA family outer membrane protein, partial [Candidatus Krumholzibacteria bacterium]|nr:BamA/TamA family outer membrane protein [Candidatus Krumholzibacteria bacterium]
MNDLIPEKPGRRFFGPSWGEGGILVCVFDGTSRDIILADPGTGAFRTVAGTTADERDPMWCRPGEGFLYASDRTGIFNVYHARPGEDGGLMATRVIGGAFQPFEFGEDLLFASYGAEGYEIRRIERWRAGAGEIDPESDDEDLMELRMRYIGCPSSGSEALVNRESERFKVSYTPPFVFPRLLVYDGSFRFGLATDSRDYLDRQSVYAAGSAGFDGEFDAQLGLEVRQLKPTFRFDLLRMRKYHEYDDPLAGEVTVRYDLWDAYFGCVFELDTPTLLHRRDITLQYNHGEYGLNINAWQVYDYEIGWTYYKADEFSLLFDYRTVRREVTADINPRRGRAVHAEATASISSLQSGDFEYSFQPLYDKNNFSRFIVAYEEYLPLPFWSHALTLYGRIGWIDREKIDDFFHLYLGSREGLRGYSYYSIGGTKNAMARITYRFPILPSIER